MSGITININKTAGNIQVEINEKDTTQEMVERVNKYCYSLFDDSNEFNRVSVFDDILDYIENYDRILYAPISNTIYACYDEHDVKEAEKMIGTMNSNIEAVVAYTRSQEFEERKNNAKNKALYDDARKAILKIWDHANLAQQQYSVLKQTDEEYKKKFNSSIEPIKDNIAKDLNAQLLTMVSIFTALAFLIFGGISSLDNILSNPELPLLKLMIIGGVWGLCILNLVFVFLFCVGKMTKLNLKSTEDKDATIFQKYPVVWWSNFVISSILSFSMWGYYLTKRNIHTWFDDLCFTNPLVATIVGSGVVGITIIYLAGKLIKATKHTNGNEEGGL